MQLSVNGKDFAAVAATLSIAQLLKDAGVENPEMVSVQLNGAFVGREDFALKMLCEGDAVDFLYFMGGGQG